MGAKVVSLDSTVPFTAARARNAGLWAALEAVQDIEFVQFVDGDCEVNAQWIDGAKSFLSARQDVAAVCGRRRERFPDSSVYNGLCDIEWDTPIGQARSCGGDVMMRTRPLRDAGGYRESMIAGEEPELCVRLRAAGWKVWRLDAEMTLHDAAMNSLPQWWKRTCRAGHAYAEGAHLHGAPPERHNVAQVRRALAWGLFLPGAAIAGGMTVSAAWLLALLVYPAQILRLALRGNPAGLRRWQSAFFLTLGKFPECQGVLTFHLNRLRGHRTGLIEYK
jgi:GT2 family glycosyltransferase